MSAYKSIKWPDPARAKPADDGRKKYKPVYERIAENDYEAKVPADAKRMVKSEQIAMFQLLSMIDVTHRIMDNLERRLSGIPRGLANMKMIRSLVSKLSLDVLDTIPIEQREHMVNQMKGLVTMTAVRNQLPINEGATFGLFLNNDQLSIVEDALREQCMLCTTEDHGEQAKCKYAKLMNVLPLNKMDENARGCGWFHGWDI